MSPLIILVMTIMFGLLVLILATAVIVCIVKKVYKRTSAGNGANYQQVQEQDQPESLDNPQA